MMFLSRTQVIAAVAAVGLALYVLDLVRRRKLSEEFSLLWLLSTAVIALLGFSTGVLRLVTRLLGILYESSTVFAAGIGFAVILLLYLSVRISRLAQENQLLTRELALLRGRLEERGGGGIPAPGDGGEGAA
jgi:hypothetical protein